MNNRFCTVKHNPPESYGDCIRACVATLIDSDEVPHFFTDPDGTEAWKALRAWLKERGFTLSIFGTTESPETFALLNPDVIYMLLCRTAGSDHAVLWSNGKKVHDPSWYPEAINGPHSSGYWIFCHVGREI